MWSRLCCGSGILGPRSLAPGGSLFFAVWFPAMHVLWHRSSRATQSPFVKVPLGLGHLQSSEEYSFCQSSLMEFQCFPSWAVMKGLSEQRGERVLPPPPTCSEKRGSEEAVGRDGHRRILTPTPGVWLVWRCVSGSDSLITKLSLDGYCTEWSFKTLSWVVPVSFKTNLKYLNMYSSDGFLNLLYRFSETHFLKSLKCSKASCFKPEDEQCNFPLTPLCISLNLGKLLKPVTKSEISLEHSWWCCLEAATVGDEHALLLTVLVAGPAQTCCRQPMQ